MTGMITTGMMTITMIGMIGMTMTTTMIGMIGMTMTTTMTMITTITTVGIIGGKLAYQR